MQKTVLPNSLLVQPFVLRTPELQSKVNETVREGVLLFNLIIMNKLESLKMQTLASEEMICTLGGMNPDAIQKIEWVTRTNVASGSSGNMGTSANQSIGVDVFGDLSLDSK